MSDKTELFLQKREDVLNNFAILHFDLDKCIEMGMIDSESVLYNRIDSLINEIKIVNTIDELEELITLSKAIEMQIDAWLVSQGETTMSLSWPSLT